MKTKEIRKKNGRKKKKKEKTGRKSCKNSWTPAEEKSSG